MDTYVQNVSRYTPSISPFHLVVRHFLYFWWLLSVHVSCRKSRRNEDGIFYNNNNKNDTITMEEEEYNPNRRRDLIDELEMLFEATCLFCCASRDSETKELFWCMQQLILLKLSETKLNCYTTDWLYRDQSDEHNCFVEEILFHIPHHRTTEPQWPEGGGGTKPGPPRAEAWLGTGV